MLEGMKIPPLQDRGKANRLIFFYKVVEGLVPALPSSDYLTPVRTSKRKVTPKSFQNYNSDNIIKKYSTNNSKCFVPIQCKTSQFNNSFFLKTIIQWNKLKDSVVCAKTVDSFRSTVLQWI
ncbi:hypothetical protein DPMN_121757 [Dreissena polymorpha]|uniref:Uncharacterized protein n=1 Tax=Dreissena polymorpha TaxID=45954 RepID=A0A9D4GNC2_DREPO|nr:hypothetical protein DPMN_121757 [Dreissena polymorpha]